ncbi:histone deacetylase 8 [Primulina eburnea]|uniref:histone deacetylase 8 n=1 Tax=Primulina eburnea TaxID=1245227 RepID=UPI003C6C34C0
MAEVPFENETQKSNTYALTHQPPHSPSNPPSAGRQNVINVFWHEGMLRHETGGGVFDSGEDPGFLDVLEKHPENADRVRNMVSILKRGPISPFISWHKGRPALISELLSFHTQEYINELVEADRNGDYIICPGTFLNPGSWDAALLAAGTTLSAMKHILDGDGEISYALVRPPGHHAQPTQADGYCFLNNAGLAIQLALSSDIKKVVVLDIDVHYGNGTAEGFYCSDRVLAISLHMNHGSWGPSHPQKGTVDELGEREGFGYNLNIPLPNGTGDKGYEYAMNELVISAIRKFEPEIMVLVIGQDSSAFDPNGRQCLTMEGYRKIGSIVRGMANKYCNGRVLIVQEGGYHVTYSAYCLHATLEGVLHIPTPLLSDPIAHYPEDESFAVHAVESMKKYHQEFVPFLK